MTMIPDQVMDAIHFAEFVMAKEKKDRIGSAADTVYPMKFFLFHGQKDILGLMGAPFHHPSLDDKDVMALVVWVFVQALDAKAVLHVMEAWTAKGHGRASRPSRTPDSAGRIPGGREQFGLSPPRCTG
jgi:hypothetical protein